MARVQPLISNFTAGELGPRLHGRAEQERYFNGAKTIENMFVWRQGPAERRPGTRFIAAPKDQANTLRLIPFEYSTEQAYVIEAGERYFRVYKDGGRIESPPGTAVEIATPYPLATLSRVKWCQSADVLYLFHPDFAPRKLMRYSHTDWRLAVVDWVDGPYLPENPTNTKTMAPSAASGASITITAAGHSPFAATDVGRLVRMKHGATWGHAKITEFVSATSVKAEVKVAFGGTNAVPAWRLGLWSESTGWPACGTFHEERLVTGGVRTAPQRIDGSASNDFETFRPGVEDADAISYTIGSNQVNVILWLESWRQLIIGTPSAEFRMGSESQQQGLTPTNVMVRRETRHGCADRMPVAVDADLVFLQRQRRKVRALGYSLEADGYVADDLTLWADHIAAEGGIVDMAYAQEPNSVLWAARADGCLIGCTVMRTQKVTGWHRHPLGGDGRVEAVAVIPSGGSAGHDELWMVVRRTIGGQTRRFVERMEPPFADDADVADAWFVDAGLDYDREEPAVTFGGLQHLAGETVQVLADGAVHPPCLVSSGGEITLMSPAKRVVAGLGYASRLQSMPIEAGQADGTAQARKRRINRVMVRLYRTLGCRVGVSTRILDEVTFRSGFDRMDSPPPLYTGDKTVHVDGTHEDPTVWVVQDQPLPLTVVAIVPQVSAHD